MLQAGTEIVERWREVGEWWAGDQTREYVRSIHDGARKTSSYTLASRSSAIDSSNEEEDLTEEIALQKQVRRQRRDTWHEYASRNRERLPFEAPDLKPLASHRSSIAIHVKSPANPYVPLHVCSGYAFGRGVMHASDIPALAAMRGLPSVALVDPFSLVGAVEFVRAAKKVGVKPLIGASFVMEAAYEGSGIGGEILLIARSKRGYQNLSCLTTECHLEEARLHPLCNWDRLSRFSTDLICLTGGEEGPINQLLSNGDISNATAVLEKLLQIFGKENVFVEIERHFSPWEQRVNSLLLQLCDRYHLIPVAGGLITHERPEHFPAQDILVCANTLCLVDEILGRKLSRDPSQYPIKERPTRWLNAERYLRTAQEMHMLFSDIPQLLTNTQLVADRCDLEVLPGRTRLPESSLNDAETLYQKVWVGAMSRHRAISRKLQQRLEYELARISALGYSTHFLAITEACEWARSRGILFSGRGSVVDSAVAYCLGLSRIDAFEHRLHFDRFLPADGSKRPDIDIDFEASRRDDVRNYLSERYGQDRVATVSAIGTFGTRGIIREAGKAMGLSDPVIGQFAKLIHGGVSPERLEKSLESRPELRDSGIPKERFKWIIELAPILADIPRNIRSHSSGVVISSEPIQNTVPMMSSGVEDVPIIQWDKRSAKHFFDKFDILCLRGQDVLSGAQDRIRIQSNGFNVEQIPLDDPETYRTMRSGQLIGVPQSASPAMRQAHIRLKTADLHDASLVQAGIRPGVGGSVKLNELIARRRGKPYSFLHPELEKILGITYGIIVFQEQVDQLLQTFCGYTSGEAESIREAIHENRKSDYGASIMDEMLARITERGHSHELGLHVFDLVAGFKGYGFAQGHALAFAEISIRSIYCQQNFPAQYFASLLDAQPAGYYGPCTIANEARVRGVAILPPDVNLSSSKFQVEDVKSEVDPKIVVPDSGIRVSIKQIGSISKELRNRIVSLKPFRSFFEFVRLCNPARDELEHLILSGCLDSLYANRRALLWAIPTAYQYASSSAAMSRGLNIPLMEPNLPLGIKDFLDHEKAIFERAILGMDIKTHLMAFERERIHAQGVVPGTAIAGMKNGEKAIVVGNPLRLRFPPTASGKRVVFFDLEDETGLLNVTCFDDVYRRDGHAIVTSAYVTIRGEAQDRDGHMAFLAHRVFPYSPKLNSEVSPRPSNCLPQQTFWLGELPSTALYGSGASFHLD